MQAKRKRKDHIGKTLKQILNLEYRGEKSLGSPQCYKLKKMFASKKFQTFKKKLHEFVKKVHNLKNVSLSKNVHNLKKFVRKFETWPKKGNRKGEIK